MGRRQGKWCMEPTTWSQVYHTLTSRPSETHRHNSTMLYTATQHCHKFLTETARPTRTWQDYLWLWYTFQKNRLNSALFFCTRNNQNRYFDLAQRLELNEMFKMSYFYTNTDTETFAPLITCVTDDTDGEKCSSRSTKSLMSMNWSSVWLMSGMVLSKVLSTCESMKFWAFNLTPHKAPFYFAYHIC